MKPTTKALKIAVMTISDTRTEADDRSGHQLIECLTSAGHNLVDRCIVRDNRYLIRERLSIWIASPEVEVALLTGGTGLTGRDITPEAVAPLFDKPIEGFGELFRSISYDEIGTSTIQSRALAGVANGTFIFCLPGSTNACKTAWDKILRDQLDMDHLPCNFAQLLPRLREQ